ncbi:MAG: hypothetical protein R2752_11825 [Vicinamibacterales bacterium]
MNWTPEAEQRFESYKGRVRRAVAGNPTVDPDDVVQDIQAHVDAELGAASGPVTLGALEQVLETLGSPTQWDDGQAGTDREPLGIRARRLLRQMQAGLAGDWGLPVLLVVLTVVSLFLMRSVGLVLLALAYLTARSLLTRSTVPLGADQRKVILVPIAVVAALIVGVAVATPLLIMGRPRTVPAMTGLGVWWILLGLAASREPKRVRAALFPLADWFEPSHGRLLMLFGASLLGLAFVTAVM